MTTRDDRALTRRTFLGGMAAATAPMVLGSPAPGTSSNPKIAVIGAGAFGAWTALHLLRKGADVILFDAWGPGNSRASSGGEGRAIRAIYGKDRIYTEMVVRSFALWEQLEKEAGTKLYTETGALWLLRDQGSYVREALPILADLKLPVAELSPVQLQQKYPSINPAGIQRVFLEKKAGVLAARRSCQTLCQRFIAEGGTFQIANIKPKPVKNRYMPGILTADGKTIHADQFVFAAGPWLGGLFPHILRHLIQPTRQEVYYFGTPAGSRAFRAPEMPMWIDFGARIFYGFPDLDGRGFKVADDTRGLQVQPTHFHRQPTPELLAKVRSFMKLRFPALRQAPLLETRVCQYENSPDGQLILDRHPYAENVWFVGGGSGHGFKLSPAVGEMAANALLGHKPSDPRFSLARFKDTVVKGTQFDP